MSWEKTTIGAHCVVTSSKRFNLNNRVSIGVPFYCSKQLIQRHNNQDVTDFDCIEEIDYKNIASKFGVPIAGDLLVTTRGTNGIPYIYKNTDYFYFADGNLSWFKDFDDLLKSRFLYYWILSYEGQNKFNAISKGTAQKAIPINGIKDIEIFLPPLAVQQKIADILSAYDDLIENNQSQIKLLEEAAQRLYKEWFIDFRFSGHENVKILDGLPTGWEKSCASSYFEITIGKTPSRAESKWFSKEIKDTKWLSIADMGKSSVFILDSAENLTEDAIKQHNIKVVPKGTVLLSFKLTVGRVAVAAEDIATNEAIAHFHIKDKLEREYLYLQLQNYNWDSLGSTSAISRAVNSTIIKAMPLIFPEKKLLMNFHANTKNLFGKILALQKQIKYVQTIRDALLPKLMSGELEV